MTLRDAALALEDLANGQTPDHAALIGGALALDTLTRNGEGDRDILDAAAGLETLATGGTLDLDSAGRERAAHLAAIIRRRIAEN